MCLVGGEEIFCFVFMGFEVGFDVGVILDVGIVCKGEWNGEEVLGMCLIFNKCYIMFVFVVIVIGLVFKF